MDGQSRFDEALRRVQAESAALRASAERLAPADWDRISRCDPWTVRQLVAHVARAAESYLASIGASLRGEQAPPRLREQQIARMNEIAAGPPAAITALLAAISARFDRELRAIRPDQLDLLATHGHGPRPIRWFVEQWLAELVFHRFDLHESLGWPAELTDDSAAFLLPMLLEVNLPAMMGSGWPRGTGRFQLVVDEQPERTWRLNAQPGALTVERASAEPAEVTLEGDPAALALLVYGRRQLPELERAQRLRVLGDRALASRFHELFKGP